MKIASAKLHEIGMTVITNAPLPEMEFPAFDARLLDKAGNYVGLYKYDYLEETYNLEKVIRHLNDLGFVVLF